MKNETLSKLHGDTRGAVLVEFAAAFLPLMITFSCFVQLAQLATAKIVVKHSAVVGARAAAVITNAKGNTPDQKKGDNNAAVTQGVRAAMGPWAKTMDSIDVTIKDESNCDDQYGLVTVTVKAEYRCSVPFGSRLLCGAFHATRPFEQKYGFPHQGARYKGTGEGSTGCGGGGGGGGGFSGGGGDFGGGGASGSF